MASIDSLETARMFDREKVYTGSDINYALERAAITGEYKPADPANIMVTGSTVAYDAKVTGSRFFYRPKESEKCTSKREEPTESGEHDHVWPNQFASFWVGALMGLFANMNNGQ